MADANTIDLTDIASVVIATAAFVLTCFEMYRSRKHDRLMTTAHLKVIRNCHTDERKFEIRIVNSGLGPAILTSLDLVFRGEVIKWKHTQESYPHIQRLLGICFAKVEISRRDPGDMIAPGDDDLVLAFSQVRFADGEPDLFLSSFEDVKVRYEYKSIYGETKKAED